MNKKRGRKELYKVGATFDGWKITKIINSNQPTPYRKYVCTKKGTTEIFSYFQMNKMKKGVSVKQHEIHYPELLIDSANIPLYYTDKRAQKLRKFITAHHTAHPRLRLTGSTTESVLQQTFKDLTWKPNSHKPGLDIKIDLYYEKNVKSGKFDSDGRLKLSSHRLTSQVPYNVDIKEDRDKALQRALTYISAEDKKSYLCLSTYKDDVLAKRYYLIHVDVSSLDFQNLEWCEMTSKKKDGFCGWKGTSPDGKVEAKINRDMSYQLWLSLDREVYTLIDIIER
jgi:hypothetical protein